MNFLLALGLLYKHLHQARLDFGGLGNNPEKRKKVP